jgi:hypothetical protein
MIAPAARNPEFSYDEETDVLHIRFGSAVPCVAKELLPGILIRREAEGGRLNGITILGYAARTAEDP